MVLDNDAFSRCTDGTAEGTPGRKSYFSLAVRGHQVTIRERIDSQTAPEQLRYDGVSFAFRDQVQIDGLIASWSFDGTALRLTDMKGGSCGDAVIWTTNPWVPHSVTAQAPALALPDGRYETVLSAEDRHLCDDRPGQHHLNREIYDPPSHPRTWYLSFTLDGGTVMEYESEVSHSAIARMGWVGSYRVYGNTFELTDLRSTVNVPAGTERRAHLAAAFTFDGKTLTLTPVGSWPCDEPGPVDPPPVDLGEEGAMTPTLVIIDDHAGFRAFARALLEAEGYDVVGEAADGSSGAELVCRLLPDVVLLDVVLPDVDGFAVSERIADKAPRCAVVLTSTRSRSSYGARVAASPARGFVAKSELSGSALGRLTG